MKRWFLWLLLSCLAGCASVDRAPPPGDEIFRDELFGPLPAAPDPAALFALSPEMRRYLDERILPQVRRKGPQMALLDALYTDGELRLEYDASTTRSAADAFAARRGNCLSLVIMTAAFAHEMGLRVRYQEVLGAPAVEQAGDLTFLVGHVNLGLGTAADPSRLGDPLRHWVLVDFLPGQDLKRQQTVELDERRIRAMYLNNRAAEALAAGRVRDAYVWLRAAHAQDRTLANLYNTLGVVYRRHGALAESVRALRVAQAMDPASDVATGNLAGLQGRGAAAASPLESARQALDAGQPKLALRLLQAELVVAPRRADLHYGLAQTYARVGDAARTRRHLELATEYSVDGQQHALYAGKLERLKDRLRSPAPPPP